MKKYMSIVLLTGALLMSGCGNSDPNVVSGFQGNAFIVAPVCADDAYTTNQNAALTVNAANGVLANDQPNGGTVNFATTSAQGGTVTGNADGSFTYTPAADFNGADSFTYSVTNTAGQVTCTVNITVISTNGFFVDATNGNDGTGSFTNGLPFQTIQAAVAAAPTNADIVVLPGNYTGAVNLLNGQRLLGSGSVLAQGATRPQLTGPIVLADGNTLDFLRIEGTAGDAVDGIGQDSGTVTNCQFDNITGAGSAAVELDGASGNWVVSGNAMMNTGGSSIFARTTGTSQMTIIVDLNEITGSDLGAVGLVAENSSTMRASVVGNTFRNNNQVTGDALEAFCGDDASFCLDLETNINDSDNNPGNGDDGVYRFSALTGGTADFDIEQLNTLTAPQPGGAGNSGVVSIDMGAGFFTPDDVVNGTCGF